MNPAVAGGGVLALTRVDVSALALIASFQRWQARLFVGGCLLRIAMCRFRNRLLLGQDTTGVLMVTAPRLPTSVRPRLHLGCVAPEVPTSFA